MTPEIRIPAADSATLVAHLIEELMGRPLTRDHMLEANRQRLGLRETARRFRTTRYQVRLAEVRTGIVLEHARDMPERVDLPPELEMWTAIEGGESFAALAERCGVSSKTIIRRLMAWGAREGRTWPPRTTQEQRLYEARQRTVEASQRLSLKASRAQEAASWTTVREEVGVNVGVADDREAEQYVMRYAKRWAANRGLPWGRHATPPRWSAEQRQLRAGALRAQLADAFAPRAVDVLEGVSDEALVLLQVYAEHDALAALGTTTTDETRPYHRYRAEAAQLVQALTGAEAGRSHDGALVLAELLTEFA